MAIKRHAMIAKGAGDQIKTGGRKLSRRNA
jgi:hypothetical protein